MKQLIGDKILIQPAKPDNTTASGIILTEASNKIEGVIVMIGPAVKALKVGDNVRLYEFAGVEYDGQVFASESKDVEAVI